MKHEMFVAALLVALLSVSSTAQQNPKFIKVDLDRGHIDNNTSISADRKRIYIAAFDRGNYDESNRCPIDIWNLESGTREKTLKLPVCGDSFAVSPDQKTVVISSSIVNSPMYAVSLETLKILWQFDYNYGNPRYSPSGRFIVTGSYGGPLFIYNALGKRLAMLDANEQGEEPCCSHAFSQDESLLVLRASNKLEVYETKNFTRLIRIPLEYGQTRSVQLTKDKNFILSYDPISRYPALWDRKTGKITKMFRNAVKCVNEWDVCESIISSDNKSVVSGSYRFKDASQSAASSLSSLVEFLSGKKLKDFISFSNTLMLTPDDSKLVYGSSGFGKNDSEGNFIPPKSYMYIWNLR